MDDQKTWKIMKQAVAPIIKMLEGRLSNRMNALEALSSSSLDGVPENVQRMREEEAAKIRAVIQEQRDIIDTMKLLYPDGA